MTFDEYILEWEKLAGEIEDRLVVNASAGVLAEAGEHHLQRFARADQRRQPGRAAEARMQPELGWELFQEALAADLVERVGSLGTDHTCRS